RLHLAQVQLGNLDRDPLRPDQVRLPDGPAEVPLEGYGVDHVPEGLAVLTAQGGGEPAEEDVGAEGLHDAAVAGGRDVVRLVAQDHLPLSHALEAVVVREGLEGGGDDLLTALVVLRPDDAG